MRIVPSDGGDARTETASARTARRGCSYRLRLAGAFGEDLPDHPGSERAAAYHELAAD